MENSVLLVQKKEHICTLILNRPEKRNSLSVEMLVKLAETLDDLSQNDDIRTIIIRGAGEKAFCAGYDIGALNFDETSESSEMTEHSNPFETAMEAIVNYPYPVIAMVNGYAFGGGCDLAASCDIRIAADDVRMGMVPAKLGVVYSLNGLKRFMRVIGSAKAKELFFTARTYHAEYLKQIGLLNYLVPKPELESFTYAMAEEISSNAPLSLKGIKRNINIINQSTDISKPEIDEAGQLVRSAFLSNDFKEGQTSFFEKRKPHFKGD